MQRVAAWAGLVLPALAAALVLDAPGGGGELAGRLLAAASSGALLQEFLRDERRRSLALLHTSGTGGRASVPRLALGQSNVSLSSAEDVNGLLTETRWALDQKLLECRARPALLRAAAERASSDLQELAGEVSQLRGVVLQGASEYPEDRVSLQMLAASTKRGAFECEKVAELQRARADDLKRERERVAEMRRLLADECGGAAAGSLLQRGAKRQRGRWPAGEVCARAAEAAAELEGELEDKSARLAAEEAASREACRGDRAFEQRQRQLTASHKSSLARNMQEATSRIGGITERTRLKDEMRARLNSKVLSVEGTCREEVAALLQKLCDLQQVRDQLVLRGGSQTLPQDCEVTDWREGVCSTSCGGGQRVSTREVLVPPSGGASCPPLSLAQTCAEQDCPRDCELSAWSGWSSCSAPCDGGFQERVRQVTTQPVGGGVPCGAVVSVRTCNSRACDRDCELGDWSAWSLCSLPCGGGNQERSRKVNRRPLGLGYCPGPEDGQRLERMPCNAHQCPEAGNVTCHGTPVDLVLAMDVSGSVGRRGVEAFQRLAEDLVRRYPLGADATRVGVVAFASESHTVSRLEAAEEALLSKVSTGLTWTEGQGASMLSRGLVAATDLAAAARPRAAPVVLVVTDGRIADPFVAGQVATRLRERGVRLLFLVVGRGKEVPTLFRRMASAPAAENLIFVPSFSDLHQNIPSVAGQVLQHTCSTVSSR